MKSVKPGRGPSAMGGIGSIFAAIFGVIWICAAASMGAPWFFSLFGVFFIIMALAQGAYHWKNATSEERFSEFDIVDQKEEDDPIRRELEKRRKEEESRGDLRIEAESDKEKTGGGRRFCPYCGERIAEDYQFCGHCGRKLPDEN